MLCNQPEHMHAIKIYLLKKTNARLRSALWGKLTLPALPQIIIQETIATKSHLVLKMALILSCKHFHFAALRPGEAFVPVEILVPEQTQGILSYKLCNYIKFTLSHSLNCFHKEQQIKNNEIPAALWNEEQMHAEMLWPVVVGDCGGQRE